MNPHLVLFPTIVFAIITYLSAFKDGKPICDRYIMNTYMYTITYMFLLAYFVLLFIQHPKFLENMNIFAIIGAMIVNIGSYLAIVFVPKEMVLLKHIISLLFIASSALTLSIIFIYFKSSAVAFATFLTIVLFILLTVIAFKFQDMISSKVPFLLLIAFIVLLIAEFLIGMFYPASPLEKFIILIVLLLLCYLVLVKTKKIIENSRDCTHPDYVKDSSGLIISFESILIRILELGRRKRIR